jgi:hypothetical protein
MKQFLLLTLMFGSLMLSGQRRRPHVTKPIQVLSLPDDIGVSFNVIRGVYSKGGPEPNLAIAKGGELVLRRNKFLYSLEFYRYMDVFDLLEGSHFRTQIGFKIGGHKSSRLFRFRYQGGVAQFKGRDQVYLAWDDNEIQSVLGITAKVGVEFMPFSFLSLGLDFEGNLNVDMKIAMPVLKVGIGNIRRKKNKKSRSKSKPIYYASA